MVYDDPWPRSTAVLPPLPHSSHSWKGSLARQERGGDVCSSRMGQRCLGVRPTQDGAAQILVCRRSPNGVGHHADRQHSGCGGDGPAPLRFSRLGAGDRGDRPVDDGRLLRFVAIRRTELRASNRDYQQPSGLNRRQRLTSMWSVQDSVPRSGPTPRRVQAQQLRQASTRPHSVARRSRSRYRAPTRRAYCGLKITIWTTRPLLNQIRMPLDRHSHFSPPFFFTVNSGSP
jgi:hypothetical protein